MEHGAWIIDYDHTICDLSTVHERETASKHQCASGHKVALDDVAVSLLAGGEGSEFKITADRPGDDSKLAMLTKTVGNHNYKGSDKTKKLCFVMLVALDRSANWSRLPSATVAESAL